MILTLLGSAVALTLSSPPPDSMLVSTTWLAERLGSPDLVLFQVGTEDEYAGAHIPGAQFLRMQDLAAPRGARPILELPSPEAIDAALEARGVSDDSRIVLYWGNDWVTPTTRLYLTLYWAGLGDRVSILEGGLPAWRAEGRPVTTERPTITPGKLTVTPRSDVVVTAAEVAELRSKPTVALIDARLSRFYRGEDTSHVRPGHIPGARNLPFVDLFDGDAPRLKSRHELAALLSAAGAGPGKLVVTYCHIGQQATGVWFVARLLGYDARLYDGSFTEWTDLPQYPVARPAGGSP